MPITAVLDFGKTTLKVALFEGGQPIWSRTAANRPKAGLPYLAIDTDHIWAFAVEALRAAAREHVVTTLVVTTHGGQGALVDGEGLALPIMDYEYGGVDAIEPDYAPLRPDFSETYSAPLTAGMNFGRGLYYLSQRHPEAFARGRHVLMAPQYWAWRLTGKVSADTTALGAHTDLMNPVTGALSSLVDRMGWQALFPPIGRAWDVVGTLKPAIAAETGLSPEVRVLSGIHDSNASLLPHLLTTPPPFTVISTGTWVVIMAVGGDPTRLDAAKDMYSNVDATGRPVPTTKFMGGREYAALLNGARPDASVEDLVAVLDAGVLALPSFAPYGGPFQGWAGRIEGMLPDRPGARAALASLYTALMTDHLLALLGSDDCPLIVDGTFAGNAVHVGILADLRPHQSIRLGNDRIGSAFGAALLADWPTPPDPALMAMPTAQPLGLSDRLTEARSRWRAALGLTD